MLLIARPAPERLGRRNGAPALQNRGVFCYNSKTITMRNGLGTAHFFLALPEVPTLTWRPSGRTAASGRCPRWGTSWSTSNASPGAGSCACSSTSPKASTSRIARASRNHLTRLFAVENIDFDRLEVSSPGLDRPLTQARRLRALRRRGSAAARCTRRSTARSGSRESLRGIEGDDVLVETAAGVRDVAVRRRSTARGSCPKIEWRKG